MGRSEVTGVVGAHTEILAAFRSLVCSSRDASASRLPVIISEEGGSHLDLPYEIHAVPFILSN
ncbi:uncharacterized protein PHALS_04093 [Plasmopara halstedii]|uniref:Uncharacterized protein n=1 Tax=Plasmopara halstedii TaxID=4781 RepID=A0A0P1A820_PLAHL|nr:uncharacterized protein PHALS_04093 [Plasmopara halstedii]CEG36838.1 hypothetical protein PHALS_04093 [Plasmopara halstedii]|eukprot:XP_024573207.1 hypothetical protein PHALS_04093 [Plasmopara halstedii]